MNRIRARIGLFVVCGTIVVFLVGLHGLGAAPGMQVDWADPVGWVRAASAEDALTASLRTIGLGAGYWLLAGTVVCGLLRHRTSAAPRVVRLLTIPSIRRLVDRALAVSLAVSITATPLGPALAAEPTPEPTAVAYDINRDGIPIPHLSPGEAVESEGDTSAAAEPDPDAAAAPADSAVATPLVMPPVVTTSAPSPSEYVVMAGDNLWVIAERRVTAVLDSDTSSAAVAGYWRRLIAENRQTLRSGDPNLIYPGEIVTLPPVEAAP